MSLDITYRPATPAEVNVLAHTFDTTTDELSQGLPSLLLCYCPDGTQIIKEGDLGQDVFCILRGHVVVEKKWLGWFSQRVARLGMGDVFGEMGFLKTAGGRSASVTTEGDCRLFRMNAGELNQLMLAAPAIGSRLQQISRHHILGLR